MRTLRLQDLNYNRLRVQELCHTCNFIARFCRATLSRDKIASVTLLVAQLKDLFSDMLSEDAEMLWIKATNTPM